MRKIWSFKELKGLIAAPALSRLSSWCASMNICEYLRYLRLATAGDPKCEGRRPKQIRIAGNGAVDKLQSQRDCVLQPRVARGSQPWAPGRNPFGILGNFRKRQGTRTSPKRCAGASPSPPREERAGERRPFPPPSKDNTLPLKPGLHTPCHPSNTPILQYSIPPILHSFPRRGADRRRHRRCAIAAAGGDEIRGWTSHRRGQRPSQMFLSQSRTCNT